MSVILADTVRTAARMSGDLGIRTLDLHANVAELAERVTEQAATVVRIGRDADRLERDQQAVSLSAGEAQEKVRVARAVLDDSASQMATATAEKALFYQIAVTAAASPLMSLLLGEQRGWSYSGYAWFSIALQTVIGAFATYLAWMWLVRHFPATRISSFTFLTPLFALVFGVVLLKEPLTVQLVLALLGVGVGILLVNRKAGRVAA